MPLQTITLAPGVNTEATPTQNMGVIQTSQLIRFKAAGNMVLAEKMGGWQKFYPQSVGSPIRALHAWEGINADSHLGIGAEESLSVLSGNYYQNVTPHIAVSNIAPDFSTVSGSAVVTIIDTNIVPSSLDSIYIETPIAIGGLILQGPYAINSVPSTNTYLITAASNATSTVSHAGALPTFTTLIGTPGITISLDNHGFVVGSSFAISTPTVVGGLTLSGSYIVQSVPTADTFTINASNAATSSATVPMNGGNAQIIYYIGIAFAPPPGGYGVNTYGTGTYGTGEAPSPSEGSPITTTNWTLDNWGEILIACPSNGPIYTWSPDSGYSVATKVIQAPLINGGIFVSEPSQILVAWASSVNGVQDPLLINWSDSSDYTNWSVTALTQAGGYRIPTGSKIVGGLQGPQFGFIWTDIDVWAMQYIQPPFVFGFNKLAEECGLIARHAACVVNSTVYWMGNNQFYLYAGAGVQPIVCSVWDTVFQDLDLQNIDKITAASNNGFGEVAWHYPSISNGTGEVDSYVKYNFILNCWDYGKLARTAWIDQSVLGQPIGGSPDGYVYQHETTNDADGSPMGEYFETGYVQISQGEELMFLDWMIPDFRYGKYNSAPNATLNITLKYTDYPSGQVKTKGPYQVNSATSYKNPRLRGRQVSMRIEGAGLGSWWRMGGLRYRAAPDGKR
ncbi:hypothetical protein [Rhizobium lusitanum]|uniref:Uncharacterized protein n=1 Tax=Rhizobium lusitanum TaxID=293958 RepID=A0A1C3VRY8_9HYPH|nr:hypothetical protein [Rhizobium lusitanum]SCB30264.1 hypothetical protein GA0061101_10683 [Rhizobium lusitanum]